ncbi:MAG TPA: PIG-L deacetylase family protein [Rhizomicrobium sp.]|nr:PIG-L deacetylase family protein [Rhizomicrobium sp.]
MKTLVVAPHPDDELLGCGGTLLKRKADGGTLAWLIVANVSTEGGWPADKVAGRNQEIAAVTKAVGFDRVYNLALPPTRLDELPLGSLIQKMSEAFADFAPEEVLLPHWSDVHTDHHVVFDVAAGCTKWFRYPSVRRVMAYETISETDFGLKPEQSFVPNVFVDITDHLERKLKIMSIYSSELGMPPFPRSLDAIRAQAVLRGAASGFRAAEAFQLLRERVS